MSFTSSQKRKHEICNNKKSDAGKDLENFEFVDQVGFILDEGGAVERLASARHALGQFLANSDRIARAGPNLNKQTTLSFSKMCKF